MDRMSFDEFKNVVVDEIREWLPESLKKADIELQPVIKNNNVKLTGLLIKRRDCNIAPTIYLEGFYQRYQDGEEMSLIMKQIVKVRMEHDMRQDFNVRAVVELENVKDHIMPRLVGVENNVDILQERPHIQIADLAVLFVIDLGTNEEGATSIPIHYGLMEMWGVTAEQLYDLANENLKKQKAGEMVSMNSMLLSVLNANEEVEELESKLREMPSDDMMFVLTNKSRINGAVEVLDKNIMESVIGRLGEDFYMLPSSVHEWIIVPEVQCGEVSELRTMVREVNDTQVQEDEILSNNVYRYTIESGLEIA